MCTVKLNWVTLSNIILVVEKCKQMLVVNGFSELKEKESWNISPKGKVCS